MRVFAVLAGGLMLTLWSAPALEAACSGPACSARAGRTLAPQRPGARPKMQRVQRVPLRPDGGDQGGSFRPSFGCNVMGCD
ncbi:MAG: hypothetical protein QOF19_3298 [Alphaproteobacteria bacterium]|nr:hypothetical protein [Alphaproteobacteria bacterium]